MTGFILAPWLIQRQAETSLSEVLLRPVTIDRVRINPYALSAEVNGFALTEPDGSPLAGFERLYVNFQLSSLFHWAWTFDELSLDEPAVNLVREVDGAINLAKLVPPGPGAEESKEAQPLPRLILHKLAITGLRLNYSDRARPTPFATELAPGDITVNDLSTLPDHPGSHKINIKVEDGITISASGHVQLTPLDVSGTASVRGPVLPLAYRYIQDNLTARVDKGDLALDLAFDVTQNDAGLAAQIDSLNLNISDTLVTDKASEAPLLAASMLALSDLSFAWPEKKLGAQQLALEGFAVSLWRNPEGEINLQNLLIEAPQTSPDTDQTLGAEATGADEQQGTSALDDWDVSLAQLAIRDSDITFNDRALATPAELSLRLNSLTLDNIDNKPQSHFPLSFSATMASGGELALEGDIQALPAPEAALDLSVDGLELAAAQPYLSEYARMLIGSGKLSAKASVQHTGENPLNAQGQASLSDLSINGTKQKKQLLGWQNFVLDRFSYSADSNRLELSTITVDRPHLRLRIYEDSTTNFTRLMVAGDTPADEVQPSDVEPTVTEAVPREPESAQPPAASPPFVLTLARVTVVDASADFSDRTLPILFQTFVKDLNGELTELDTTSSQPASLRLEGQVDDYGLAKVDGTLLPTDPRKSADITLLFRNLELPDLNPYTIKFAGREIADGRMSLDLKYKIHNGLVEGKNNIVISDLELGKKVAYEGALDLPLDLAVALLKNAEGKIDLDLPVEGDMNKPRFSFGSIIAGALGNLITKAVTAPFRLLGALVGAESENFDRIQFEAGQSTLTPPEREKLVKLAQALEQRPTLALKLGGVYAEKADPAAIKKASVERAVEQQLAASEASDKDEPLAQRRQKILEGLYTQRFPESPLADIKSAHQKPTDADNPDSGTALDSAAYRSALRTRLVESESVTEDQLIALANARSRAISEQLSTEHGLAPERVIDAEIRAVKADKNGWIDLKLDVKTR